MAKINISAKSVFSATVYFVGLVASLTVFTFMFEDYRAGAFSCLLCQLFSIPFLICIYKKKAIKVAYAVILFANLINLAILLGVQTDLDDLRFSAYTYAFAIPAAIAFFLLKLVYDKIFDVLHLDEPDKKTVGRWNLRSEIGFGVCFGFCAAALLLVAILKNNPYKWFEYICYSIAGALCATMVLTIILANLRNKAVKGIARHVNGTVAVTSADGKNEAPRSEDEQHSDG